jgi:hypothetical protein
MKRIRDIGALPLRNSHPCVRTCNRTAIGCRVRQQYCRRCTRTCRTADAGAILVIQELTQSSRNYYCVAAWCLLRLQARCEGAVISGYPSRIDRPCEWAADYPAFAPMQFYRTGHSRRNQPTDLGPHRGKRLRVAMAPASTPASQRARSRTKGADGRTASCRAPDAHPPRDERDLVWGIDAAKIALPPTKPETGHEYSGPQRNRCRYTHLPPSTLLGLRSKRTGPPSEGQRRFKEHIAPSSVWLATQPVQQASTTGSGSMGDVDGTLRKMQARAGQ